MSWLARIGGSLGFTGSSTEGIKVGPKESTDWGWRDLKGFPKTIIGPQLPVFGTIASSPTSAGLGSYKFLQNGDTCYFTYHVPHDYVLGSEVHFHIHWFSTAAVPGDIPADSTLQWDVDYVYSKGHDQQSYVMSPVNTVPSLVVPFPSVRYQHIISESDAFTISGMEPDGLIIASVRRTQVGGSGDAAGAQMLTSDLHYRSTNLSTINKSPNFYGE